jgi:hypothetical protein
MSTPVSKNKEYMAHLTELSDVMNKTAPPLPPSAIPAHLKGEVKLSKKQRASKEELEQKLVLLQRLLFRNVSKKDISVMLQCTIRQVYNLIELLKTRTVNEVRNMDYPLFIGQTVDFYNEIRGMALLTASSKEISDHRIKLTAMQVALRAEEEKHKFFALAGIYKTAPAQNYATQFMTTKASSNDGEINPHDIVSDLALEMLKLGSSPADIEDATIITPEVK